ncbi:MAG: glycosyltransferase family A protein, partial [Algoriphagus sp.]
MRIHYNPNKDLPILPETYWHQVIVPIYIPSLEGYYSESFEVLKICLESLFQTSHDKTYFTCINNGSGDFVKDYLNQLLAEGKIHEVIHTTNIGKINSILKGINGHDFQIITVTDSDVLFLSGWQQESYSMFQAFPKLAALSTSPNSKLYKFHTWNIIKEFI